MRTRTVAVAAGLGAVLSAALLTAPAAAGDVETVKVRDDCDAASFNAALGEGACDPRFGGDTTFQELEAALHGGKGARAMEDGRLVGWRNNPVVTKLDRDESLRAVSDGGELHTFSRVEKLGGGCVPPLNDALGLPNPGRPGNNCRTFTDKDLVPAGTTLEVPRSELKRGTNLFQCLIHPWMHTTVHVH